MRPRVTFSNRSKLPRSPIPQAISTLLRTVIISSREALVASRSGVALDPECAPPLDTNGQMTSLHVTQPSPDAVTDDVVNDVCAVGSTVSWVKVEPHDQQTIISVNRVVDVAKSFRINGEPGGNRTHNPQIKSLNCPSCAELC
jgi:hypothetical protein